MPLVIDSTPGAATANSYISLADANTYHTTVLDPVVWDDADNDTRGRALISATRKLDAYLSWIGYPWSYTQKLGWPRYAALTRTGSVYAVDVVPEEVKHATAEFARRLIASGGGAAGTGSETLKSLKAGPIDLVFRDEVPATAAIPADVVQMVAHLTRSVAGSNASSVPIVRV